MIYNKPPLGPHDLIEVQVGRFGCEEVMRLIIQLKYIGLRIESLEVLEGISPRPETAYNMHSIEQG